MKWAVDTFAALLEKHKVTLTVSTRYPLGCFGLQPEMPILKQAGRKNAGLRNNRAERSGG